MTFAWGAAGLLALLSAIPAARATDSGVCDVRDFGARGDGRTLDTAAIQRAVDACAARGGGTVRLGPGRYVSGTLVLRSHITFRLDQGAVLAGSHDLADYLPGSAVGLGTTLGVDVAGEGTRAGLLTARDADDVAIVGPGTIDGQSGAFMTTRPHTPPDYAPQAVRDPARFEAAMRDTGDGPLEPASAGRPGVLVLLLRVRDARVADVRFVDSPNWTLVLQSVERARIDGIAIVNDMRVPNNDGIDCNACRDVHVARGTIRTGDDDIAVSESRDVTVSGMSLASRSAAVRVESTEHAVFSDLTIDSNRGLAVFASRRLRRATDGVIFHDVVMRTHLVSGHWWGKGEPIYVSVQPCEAGGACAGGVRHVAFSSIEAESEAGAIIEGAPGLPVDGVELRDVRLRITAPQPELARAVGGNFDRRWTAATRDAGIVRHDIPAIWASWTRDLVVRDVSVGWGEGLPEYDTSVLAATDFAGLIVDGLSEHGARGRTGAALDFVRGSGVSIERAEVEAGRKKVSLREVTDVIAPGLVQ